MLFSFLFERELSQAGKPTFALFDSQRVLFKIMECFFVPVFVLCKVLLIVYQVDVSITPGTHASEEAGKHTLSTLHFHDSRSGTILL